jgi:plasmid stabilization system protein ParE
VKRFFRPAAREDMQRQFRYYLVELDVPEVALRFLDSVEDAIRVIIRQSRHWFPTALS